jgi:hypothetical protein
VSEAKPAGGARTLPHSLEAERAVLGSILLHPPALAEVAGKCQPRDMYHPAHTAIFEAMVDAIVGARLRSTANRVPAVKLPRRSFHRLRI